MREVNQKVVKAGIGYTVGNYMLKCLNFITLPVFASLLSPAEYGVFNSYLAYQGVMFLLVGLALHTSLKNAKYRYGDDFDRYNASCIGFMLLSLFGWLLFANLTYPLYGGLFGFSRLIVNLLLCDSFGLALIQFYNVYVGISYRYEAFLKVAAANAILNFVMSVFLILTVFRENRAIGRILGNAFPVLLIAAVLIYSFWKKARPAFDKEYAKFAFGYSLPIIPHGISQVILSQFDRIMIKEMISEEKSGIYSFAYNIFMIVNVTINSLDSVFSPWFYEKMEAKDYGAIRTYSGYYVFGMMLFTVMVMLGMPEIILLLGNGKYGEAVYSVIPIVIGGYFTFLYSLPVCVEYYYGKTKFISLGTGIAAVMNIVLNLIFIERFGYIAAAYTTMATYLVYFLLHYLISSKIFRGAISDGNIGGSRLFHTGKLAGSIVAVMAVGAASFLLIPYWYVRWGILFVVFLITLLWLEKKFGILTKIIRRVKKEILHF